MTRARRGALLLALLACLGAAAAPAAGAAPPSLTARAAILLEFSSGDVAYARAPDERRPVASATKLMTALVALGRVDQRDVLAASRYRAAPVESVLGLRAGERMRVRDLVRALLLASANDAAVTLAERVSGSVPRFVAAMNARARALGLRNTRYTNPIGLDSPGAYSTARDLARLALAVRRDPFLRATVDLPRATLASGARVRTILNRNRLVRHVPWVDGVKTGYTQGAGYVLVGSATRDGVSLISVVLGAPTEAAREADTLALLEWGFDRYRRRQLVRRGQVLARSPVEYGGGEEVALMAGRSLHRVLRRSVRVSLRVIGAPEELAGPLPAGHRVGTVEVRAGDAKVGAVPLVTGAAVPEAGLGPRLVDYFSRPTTILLIVAAAACTLPLAAMRRRVVRGRRAARGGATS